MSTPSFTGDRVVPALARELAARLSELFVRDVEIVERLNDAQRRLKEANERLWSGLSPDAFGLIYDDSAVAAVGSSEVAALMDGARDAKTAALGALAQIHWSIHRGFCEYQSACEERRQLAVDVGEIIAEFIEVLCGAGFSEDDARAANVHELASQRSGEGSVSLVANHYQGHDRGADQRVERRAAPCAQAATGRCSIGSRADVARGGAARVAALLERGLPLPARGAARPLHIPGGLPRWPQPDGLRAQGAGRARHRARGAHAAQRDAARRDLADQPRAAAAAGAGVSGERQVGRGGRCREHAPVCTRGRRW